MRRTLVTLSAILAVVVAAAVVSHALEAAAHMPPDTQASPGVTPPPGPQGTPGVPPPGRPEGPPKDGGPGGKEPPFQWNPARAESLVTELLSKIAGREDAPAESVYKNIQILKGMPAKRVAPIMVMGFSRSLGMRCGGCHVRDDFSKDDKANKKVARAMWAMTQDINKKYLAEMHDLEDEMPTVNCWTCHRGSHEPEMNAPGAEPAKPQQAH